MDKQKETLEMLKKIKNAEDLEPATAMIIASLTTIIFQLEKIAETLEKAGKE